MPGLVQQQENLLQPHYQASEHLAVEESVAADLLLAEHDQCLVLVVRVDLN